MSRQPPDEAIPPPPVPALPVASATPPDGWAGVALAGFVCGVVSFIASMLAGLDYVVAIAAIRYSPGAATPGLSSGEVVLLIVGSFPLALVGLVLSMMGRRSTSRRRLAIAGTVLSLIALVPFAVLAVVLFEFVTYCSAHSCF